MATPVLLLRAPTSPPETDRYETALRSAGFHPVSVPVLETAFANIHGLSELLAAGPQDVGGVIVTSARAAEAWANAVESVAHLGNGDEANWTAMPFYAVGAATADSLSSISSSSRPLLCPKDIRGAAESGTAELLAHFILSDLDTSAPGTKLLYLTGDKNRETLPGILKSGGVELMGLQVYATQGSKTFRTDLEEALRRFRAATTPWWVTFFAPSAAAYVVPILRAYFLLSTSSRPSGDIEGSSGKKSARIAAIGPTTSEFLDGQLGLLVEVVPQRPSAEELTKALRTEVP
ncbi:hypothetical protein HETIRDRAFT_322098 [Heterobasidion irregulare TC 32-1]|uniref:Tetrapyrrole biosynthesis uroporphyrinogen III synthase domain-containing protein n=1 Tax=Heterobasidion irregulare (strain TC 32-1) TaxID=747525 RepID=W4K3A6_HETIT|nr:uncharacterized protein HETIRDRAFT_322098 [Heterobasidion irregulare TC 32-1]ETW79810.1 hypothetical protein HETIRDRAFT_322098 [Heterobasidion irregulare TC 32-1]